MQSESMALLEIMEIVSLPGELYSDGDCLDLIINVLKDLGLPVMEEITRNQKEFENIKHINWETLEIKEIIWNVQNGSEK